MLQHTTAAGNQVPASSEEATWTADTLTIHRQTVGPMLLQALRDSSITTIKFSAPDFALHSAWDHMGPVLISRNITVTSVSNPPTVLDMQFLSGRIALDTGVDFTFQNINLANDRQVG